MAMITQAMAKVFAALQILNNGTVTTPEFFEALEQRRAHKQIRMKKWILQMHWLPFDSER